MLRLTCLTKVQCFSGSGGVPSGSSLTLPLQQQREASFNSHLLALHKAHCRDIVHFVKLKLCSSMYKSLRWVNPLRESSRPFLQCRLHVRMSLQLLKDENDIMHHSKLKQQLQPHLQRHRCSRAYSLRKHSHNPWNLYYHQIASAKDISLLNSIRQALSGLWSF